MRPPGAARTRVNRVTSGRRSLVWLNFALTSRETRYRRTALTRQTGRTRVARLVVFVLSAAFIILAPAYRQVLHGEVGVPAWQMFGDTSLWVYKIRFETDAAGGGRRELDRFEVLGYPDPLTAPREVRLVIKQAQARELAGKICEKVGGDQPVYMRLERAESYGWTTVKDGRENVCPAPAPGVR